MRFFNDNAVFTYSTNLNDSNAVFEAILKHPKDIDVWGYFHGSEKRDDYENRKLMQSVHVRWRRHQIPYKLKFRRRSDEFGGLLFKVFFVKPDDAEEATLALKHKVVFDKMASKGIYPELREKH